MTNKYSMTFCNSIKTCLKKYFTIKGRAGRREYWYFSLLFFIIVFLQFLFTADYLLYRAVMSLLLSYVCLFISIILIIPYITVSIRRLHDISKPGILFLIILIPLIGATILVIYLCKKPYTNKNKYGTYNKIG